MRPGSLENTSIFTREIKYVFDDVLAGISPALPPGSTMLLLLKSEPLETQIPRDASRDTTLKNLIINPITCRAKGIYISEIRLLGRGYDPYCQGS